MPDRRHLVADRNRRHHDHPPSRGHHDQAGLRDLSDPPGVYGRTDRRRRRQSRDRWAAATSPSPGPGPAMLRGIWGDPDRFQRDLLVHASPAATSPATVPELDDDGYLWLLGRVDDVMNVSGSPHLHRRGGVQRWSSHPAVAEAAVVGATDATAPARPIVRLRHPARWTAEASDEARRGLPPARNGQEARPHRSPQAPSSSHPICRRPRSGKDHAPPPPRRRRRSCQHRRSRPRWPMHRSSMSCRRRRVSRTTADLVVLLV